MTTPQPSPAPRKHLMPPFASAEELAAGHRDHHNGIRAHRVYIVVVSMTALVMLVAAIAVASARM